jgi:hypothetical protein
MSLLSWRFQILPVALIAAGAAGLWFGLAPDRAAAPLATGSIVSGSGWCAARAGDGGAGRDPGRTDLALRDWLGAAAQRCGQLGKQDNCQVTVTLSLANRLPVAYRLYLPEDGPGIRRVDGDRLSPVPPIQLLIRRLARA